MSNELKQSFSKLSINEKRNQISNELIIISELIKMKEESLNLPSILTVKNYDENNEKNLTEDEVLDFFYEDIYNIEKELITIFSINE